VDKPFTDSYVSLKPKKERVALEKLNAAAVNCAEIWKSDATMRPTKSELLERAGLNPKYLEGAKQKERKLLLDKWLAPYAKAHKSTKPEKLADGSTITDKDKLDDALDEAQYWFNRAQQLEKELSDLKRSIRPEIVTSIQGRR
jgi:hypothetical protein